VSVARRGAPNRLDAFVRGYVDGALEYFRGRLRGARVSDIDPDAMEQLVNRAARFYDSKWHVIGDAIEAMEIDEGIRPDSQTQYEHAGRHFFFVSNDLHDYFKSSGDWPVKQAEILSKAGRAFYAKYGGYELSLSDDGVVVGERT
jgi:hypothetical protein